MARSARGAACAPERQTLQDVTNWLLHEASSIDRVMLMFEEFMWRSRASGVDVDRATLHIATLHPQLIGFSWVWNTSDGFCDEIAATAGARESAAFKNNPLSKVMFEGETIVADLETVEGRSSSPLMGELAAEGYTEYVAMPLSAGGDRQNAITFATKRPGGFPETIAEDTKGLLEVFALHVERHIIQRIARNVVDTYLGPNAGARVLSGEIRRGDGEAIKAVIFVSDLRGFTRLTDRLSGPDVATVLNSYFEVVSSAVLDHGGDILKFIGDGILAVFPTEQLGHSGAAERALAAARQSLNGLRELNQAAPEPLDAISAWRPLQAGIALHEGEVFFGNVGAKERLDFTVIGRAVNETSRVESLCKQLDRPLLITDPVAAALGGDTRTGLELMGAHQLRGVEKAMNIFAVSIDQPVAAE
ncbi:MAG: adenylate/guanylate cyclase domain-containing protein [Roseibium sp.]|nr:adenylate/guanylate cyclase domain-containing protein [Roseibium sp.]